jgi:Uma2 family endonuclease
MTREEFHALYEQAPEDFKAELIGGVVYVASPLRQDHASIHVDLSTLLGLYRAGTPGVEAADNATVLLGVESEPQPDLLLRLLPEFGGQSRVTAKNYIEGPPEFIVEIAHSTRAIDLHGKFNDYQRHGVLEYVVVCLDNRTCRWFDLTANQEIPTASDGVIRVRTFPGLWIDGPALFAGDHAKLLTTAQAGLATPEHAAFVRDLASRGTRG